MAILAIGLASIIAGCASGIGDGARQRDQPETLSLRGTLSYRARIALPPESIAVVELRDASTGDVPVIKELRIALQGRQVPIPFDMTLDRAMLVTARQYNVRGSIFLAGRPTWATEPLLIDPASGTIDLGTLTLMPVKPEAVSTTLRCGDQSVSIGYAGDMMHLTIGEETIEMRPVKAASGAKYEAAGDPTTTFWSKGDRAMLVVRGEAYPECMQVGAETPTFRATGNEPGWRLEISDARMTLLANYGQTRIDVPTPVAETTATFRRYVAKNGSHDLTVTINDRPCTDTMSGMPHPYAVTVVFDGETVNGCGGDPAALLQGPEWVIEDVNGTGIIDRSHATLNFGGDGRISGTASCNTYTGTYSLTGEKLAVSEIARTLMACVPALMRQEGLILDVLRNIQRFALGPDGALILHTGDGRTITARRG